ncbi:uncharacterized protein EpC_00570 [Erwinia pyrifoliae Ep1/96]|nr:uncharacterized protein EpC_00570 [Erwinia pyrifoliae Ep1/96]
MVQLVQLVQFVKTPVFKGLLTRLLNQHGAFFVGSAGRFVGSLPAMRKFLFVRCWFKTGFCWFSVGSDSEIKTL